jgi:glycosidase
MEKIVITLLLLSGFTGFAQIERVEPPNWWTGFEETGLQLMVYGENIGNATPNIDYPGVSIENVKKAKSPNYLFIDLQIGQAEAGTFDITFQLEDGSKEIYEYELKEREKPASEYVGFDNSDAIYLITPDRFANGDKANDSFDFLNEKTANRDDDYGRHGGDIRGIINHLDYIEDMGFTAIWPSPLVINDMKSGSYHGYAMTDFYRVDPRFGTLEEYRELADKAAERGIKLVMDQVANHAGIEHWWMEDLPFEDWINFQEKFENGEDLVYSNHRRTTNQDLYASETDKKGLTEGWFVETMPDLNQENPFMAKYLIQNSIWWIETLGLGGIRQDTYPYPNKEFMSDWAGSIMREYPNFNIVGEEWSLNPLLIRYWQDGVDNDYDSNLKSTMDFAMQEKIVTGLKAEETWGTGLVEIYEALANDFAYADPENIMIFPDNHDKSRIYTQLGEDVAKTKMTIAYMAVLPRIFQMYYGTEILMDDTENPGDHGLIRTEFPGGWDDSEVHAFTGEGLSEEKSDMQEFVKKVMNYRKTSEAIHSGETKHFAPQDGTYLITRKAGDEVVVLILNKNVEIVSLDLERFSELNLAGKTFKNLISEEIFEWEESLELPEEGVYFFTTRME